MSTTAAPVSRMFWTPCALCAGPCEGHELTMPADAPVSIPSCWTVPPTGWRCPGCGACYAPHVGKCYTCGQMMLTWTPTTATGT